MEFFDLCTHYFASDGIQVALRYPAKWSSSDRFRVWLCSQTVADDRLLRASVRWDTPGDNDSAPWVQATLHIPPAELEGLKSAEYWLRCEWREEDGEVMTGRCQPFVICIEPRDIPSPATSGDHSALAEGGGGGGGGRQSPTASLGSGSFVLVDEEGNDDECLGEGRGGHGPPIENGEPRGNDAAEHEAIAGGGVPQQQPREAVVSVSGGVTLAPTVNSCGIQTHDDDNKTELSEYGTQTDPNSEEQLVQLANMTASSYVNTLSEAEVGLLKSHNRDLLVKVRKLAERVRLLEQEKEAEMQRESERVELSARLKGAEEQLQQLRSQMARSDAAKASALAERDDLRAEKVVLETERDDLRAEKAALATERDRLCAEALRLRDECAGLAEGKEALVAELQCKLEELEASEERQKELDSVVKKSSAEVKCLFDRNTQLEGRLVSKENELRVSQEALSESRRELSKALAKLKSFAAANEGGGEGEGGHRSAHNRDRSVGRSEETHSSGNGRRRATSSGSSSSEVTPAKPLRVPERYDAGVLFNTYPVAARPKDEFVTGVELKEPIPSGRSGGGRRDQPQDHPRRHHRSSRPPHAHQGTGGGSSQTSGPPLEGEGVSSSKAMAPPTLSKRQEGGALRPVDLPQLGETPFTCPVCQKTLYSRDTEFAATLHVEHCLRQQEAMSNPACPLNDAYAPPPHQ